MYTIIEATVGLLKFCNGSAGIVNSFVNIALRKAFTSDFRISGLFTGYDFISFFTVLYLYVEYRCNDYKFNKLGYLKLFLGLVHLQV